MGEKLGPLGGLLATVLVLSGCAEIPSGGESGVIDVEERPERVQSEIEPEGPVEGADPNTVVRGFLAAGAGYSDDFAVARSFLTEDFANEWDPQSSVVIMPSGADFDTVTAEVSSDQQSISMTVPVDASLDGQRVYREERGGSEADRDFSLRQVNGEWRISSAPQGLVLTSSSFTTVYDSYPLYFYTPGFDHLVADPRWFVRSPAAATEVMTELLAGPADHLGGSVISALPDGARLEPRSVTVSGGIAQVGLDESAQGLDEETSARVLGQVSATLRGLSSTNAIEVTTPAGSLDAPPGDSAPVGVRIDARPVLIADGTLARLDETRVDPIPDLPELGSDPTDPAVSIDDSTYAYLTDGGQELHRILPGGDGAAVILTDEDGLTGPSFDRYGGIWTASREQDDSGRVSVTLESGDTVDVSVQWLANRSVESLRVSRDGTQLAVLSRNGSGAPRVDVIGINRTSEGIPTGVVPSAPLRVGAGFDRIVDVSWAGSAQLAVLAAENPGDEPQPYLAPVSGPARSLGDVNGGTSITASTDARSIRVSTADGELFSFGADNWQKVVDLVVHDPAYPG
ncbi:LpqB family beta-propeller domain-containing protein [Brevibacterium jeotgali]|uniref:Sporulation and spore germination n=1 Tax=Brevibacterium jeotgali TaxID=1262550 RepID=A0A2H1L682_9MICO|nr:LpqB family beta-propeller domain-containing protein [Brevibacterium jeotgali]TWC03556.1 sporulation and spore germination protein [Brevibacterium jeotgali]SMY12379.1 Sporulation and spore germination [Brevibacterium jeotgali]